MKKLKKTTTARIEDALDIVADKIIDLELTAKRLEQIERNIKTEVTRAENINLKVDLKELEQSYLKYKAEITGLHHKHQIEIKRATKQLRNLYLYLYGTIGIALISIIMFLII